MAATLALAAVHHSRFSTRNWTNSNQNRQICHIDRSNRGWYFSIKLQGDIRLRQEAVFQEEVRMEMDTTQTPKYEAPKVQTLDARELLADAKFVGISF